MTHPINRPTEEPDYELSYKIFADHGLGDPPVEVLVGKYIDYANSFLAVHWLRQARLRICDSPIAETFPYRNHCGPLTDDPHNKWGYRFRDPQDGLVKSLWLERFGGREDFFSKVIFKSLVFVSEVPPRLPEDQARYDEAGHGTFVDSG